MLLVLTFGTLFSHIIQSLTHFSSLFYLLVRSHSPGKRKVRMAGGGRDLEVRGGDAAVGTFLFILFFFKVVHLELYTGIYFFIYHFTLYSDNSS